MGTPATGDASFTIVFRGVRLGSETDTVTRLDHGWRIISNGHESPPIDIQNANFDVTYADDWSPVHLSLDALVHGQPLRITSTFSPSSATNSVTSSAKTGMFTVPVSAHTVVLPNSFYGAYEALAARLSTMKVGETVPIYIAPAGEVSVAVKTITPRHFDTPAAHVDAREFDLTVSDSVSQPLKVWVDSNNRLAQVVLPMSALTVARSDLATVMAREELVRNAGDTSVFIPMNGFSAGATVTESATTTVRKPAVVLVPGLGPQDRDEAVSGVPVFGLLAGAVADAGYLVVRYDRRGIGQTGGRTENATLEDFRNDLIDVLTWVGQRKDVDSDRIAVVGYDDGGAVAMLAAAKDDHIKGLALIGVPGSTGRDYVLEQQTRALDALHLSDKDRAAKIALEQRLIDATLTGKGGETLPPELSYSADQPIFKSWLLFNPTTALKKVDQPILILQGLADDDVPRDHADRLAAAARARKRPPEATTVSLLAGVTHSMTPPAGTTVGPPSLAPEVSTALTDWLHTIFTKRK